MTTNRNCPQCGAPLAADIPEALCPACLLKAGLASDANTVAAVVDRGGPGLDEPAGPRSANAATARPSVGEDFGPYRILRLLGRGGMGEVFEAEQLDTGRRVALKVLSQALGSEADHKRFLREGRMAASVRHPNVVYIYSSEEINGAPVIAMELVAGGTLSDRVKRSGPLPATEAVDITLQIAAGLEAAHAAGVLHRDIKPHNCFVDHDGAVKVGDFGLSIPTQPRADSLITAPGSIVGTPAFAAPEQLRGAELDVCSDIYSVGATLYFLLTGRAPFEGDDVVKLITAVLDREPDSPVKLRPEIPKGLADEVVRCLAKDRKQRFAGYDELRAALQPFSSAAPTPATLGLRYAAGLIDLVVADLPSLALMAFTGYEAIGHLVIQRTPLAALTWAAFTTWVLLYYAVSEGLWGASLGKAICGLRVVGPDRLVPGVRRALRRALPFVLLPTLPYFVEMFWMTGEQYRHAVEQNSTVFSDWGWVLVYGALFMTIRRSNGFAGLHELFSNTRVIAKPTVQARPSLAKPAAEPVAVTTEVKLFGPYAVVRALPNPHPDPLPYTTRERGTDGSAASIPPVSSPPSFGGEDQGEGALLLGRDETLRRNVWIQIVPAGAPAIPATRRDLSRAGRLRWLNGKRSANESWDAYEAPDGRPLPNNKPWAAVRFWLLDLAEEIHAGLKDQSLPPLTLDRVWITTQGRAVLLDFPIAGQSESVTLTLEEAQKFLDAVATAALGPSPAWPGKRTLWQRIRADAEEMELGAEAAPPPLHAQPFLQSLREGKLHATEFIVANLKSVCEKMPVVTRRRRLGSLMFGPGIFAVIGVFLSVMMAMEVRRLDKEWAGQHPGLPSLLQMLMAYDYAKDNPAGRRALEIQLAGRYRPMLSDPKQMEWFETTLWWIKDIGNLAPRILAAYPAPTEKELRETEPVAADALEEGRKFQRFLFPFFGVVVLFAGLAVIGVMSLICSVLFGINPVLRMLGIAVVNKRGEAASRWLLLGRTVTAWLLPVFVATKLVKLGRGMGMISTAHYLVVLPIVAVAMFVGALVWMVLAPARGPQDRLAGTWLVPR